MVLILLFVIKFKVVSCNLYWIYWLLVMLINKIIIDVDLCIEELFKYS